MTARRPAHAAGSNSNSASTTNTTNAASSSTTVTTTATGASTTAPTPAKNNNLRPRSTRVQRSSGSAASECVRLAARRFSFLVGGNRRVRPVSSARRRRENRRLGAKAAAKQRPTTASSPPASTTTTTTSSTNVNNPNVGIQASSPQQQATASSPTTTTATTTTASATSPSTSSTTTTSSPTRREISESFEIWALKTYGDSAKTKTVTRRKYVRISRILRGEEQNSAENSKFRFWVKAKGFRLGPPPPPQTTASSSSPETSPPHTPHRTGGTNADPVLYVPCAQTKGGDDSDDTVYKKVAVVENFFDIIYNVHVEMDGRGGKHAGQKRTYKAIAETYAFLPREAVTKFLMQCSDCQKRMHAAGTSGGPGATGSGQVPSSGTPTAPNGTPSPIPSASPSPPLQDVALSTPLPSPHPVTCNNGHLPVSPSASSGSSSPSSLCADPPQIDFSLPITTTYLKHMRSLGYTEEDALNPEREDCTSNADSESSSGEGEAATPVGDSDAPASPLTPIKEEVDKMRTSSFSAPQVSHFASEHSYDRPVNMTKGQSQDLSPVTWPAVAPINMSKNGDVRDHMARSLQDHTYDESVVSPCMNGMVRGQVHSHVVGREATSTPEDLSGGTKDDEDDDDDETDEKLDNNKYDPERLKAFNMFVRLFVDENLDRMVPISKQPKEKIQAIIDSCNRQFPEFAERARKRIRTYLKSCRRTKRTRDQNGWDLVRPTPPHLTSAMAEQILASACENESNNAKRMRLGMDPLSAAIQTGQPCDKENLQSGAGCVRMDTMDCAVRLHSPPAVTSTASPATAPLPRIAPQLNGSLVSATSATPFHATSVTSQQAAQPTAAAAALPTSGSGHSNGPTDLTVKKSCPNGAATKCSLNPTEVLAVKQLVAGYRESAAFLIRSADELEQLLLQQN